ncbi:CAP domain-containing protein [Corticibacter populi]|uniref:CAP domain-containing protein n=1 Tax=Corticibacter populi TaxID=1550736 RepID=A0A3M6QZ35_9BURK|nr:CAP domain-containing protein [Corticibacter populi]RMX08163.1 CAP domain-containing protein [Corticibacter populi]
MQTVQSNARLNQTRWALSILLAAVLAACGGGGGSDDSGNGGNTGGNDGGTTEPVDDGTNQNDDYAAGSRQKSAFDAINVARKAAGLEPLLQNTRIDAAAQAHAQYQTINDTTGHAEVQGNNGFTGNNSFYRVQAQGYEPAETNESISYTQYPNITGAQLAVEWALASVYHRSSFLSSHYINVGIGDSDYPASSTLGYSHNIVVNFARPSNQSAPFIPSENAGKGSVIWPVDGASNVPLALSNETPRPVPDVAYPGHPISFAVDRSLSNGGTNTLTVNNFILSCNGVPVITRLLTSANDANMSEGALANWAFLVPVEWLPANSTCSVVFKGSATSGATYDKTWSFQTGSTTYAGT